MTEDPAQQGANWYSYCANLPVDLIDQSGQAALKDLLNLWLFTDVVGALVMGLGFALKNPLLMLIGILILAIGAYLTYLSYCQMIESSVKPEINRNKGEIEDLINESLNDLKGSRSPFLVIVAWTIELQVGVMMIDVG